MFVCLINACLQETENYVFCTFSKNGILEMHFPAVSLVYCTQKTKSCTVKATTHQEHKECYISQPACRKWRRPHSHCYHELNRINVKWFFFRGDAGHMHKLLDGGSAQWSFYRVAIHLENWLTGAGHDLHQLEHWTAGLQRSNGSVHASEGRIRVRVERLGLHRDVLRHMWNWHVTNQNKKCAAEPSIDLAVVACSPHSIAVMPPSE